MQQKLEIGDGVKILKFKRKEMHGIVENIINNMVLVKYLNTDINKKDIGYFKYKDLELESKVNFEYDEHPLSKEIAVEIICPKCGTKMMSFKSDSHRPSFCCGCNKRLNLEEIHGM